MRIAFDEGSLQGEALSTWRLDVCDCLQELAAAVHKDDVFFIDNVAPSVSAVLRAYEMKRIAFMREIVYVCAPDDLRSVPCLVLGLPMLGWTCPADGLLPRVSKPDEDLSDWLKDRESRNKKVMASLAASGDDKLDRAAFQKTMDEVEAGAWRLHRPFAW